MNSLWLLSFFTAGTILLENLNSVKKQKKNGTNVNMQQKMAWIQCYGAGTASIQNVKDIR